MWRCGELIEHVKDTLTLSFISNRVVPEAETLLRLSEITIDGANSVYVFKVLKNALRREA
jgi:hypothetical protein